MTRLAPVAACVLLSALLATVSLRSAQPAAPVAEDALRAALTATAERIVLPERCGECHAAELEVWTATEHATGFDSLHRRDRAKEIYRNLDLRLIKRGTDETTPACLSCHYTPVLRRDQLRAGAGVTCESCHGAARDWVSIHNSYGVAEADFQRAALLETPEHRMRRIADSQAAGMRRPSDLYDVAANCFGCHTVPNEELVNRGGHSTGSDFELVAWSEPIRHNFLESYKTADGRTNAERPREWKRMMYVAGRALDLEYAVRGIAAATDEDELYFGAMSDRAFAAFDELVEIADRVSLPAIGQIMAIWNAVDPTVGQGDQLLAAADAMRAAAKRLVVGFDGTTLAALDPLWDPTAREAESSAPARLTEVPDLPVALPPIVDGTVAAPAEATLGDGGDRGPAAAAAPAAASTTEPMPSSVSAASAAPAPASAQPPGPVGTGTPLTRPPWRETPAHAFVKVPCGRCHNSQERWWRSDPHSGTAKPFRGSEPRNIEIARAYGVADGDMAKGSQICMWCHGTPVSAPTRNVRAGVGCQRCHGAGADYLEPHETVGYAEAVALGLSDLRDPAILAVTCAGCHYITDPGLINAGHPVGDGFDMRSRMDDIAHWGPAFGRGREPVDPGLSAAAYAGVVADRGAAPVRAAAATSTGADPATAARPATSRPQGSNDRPAARRRTPGDVPGARAAAPGRNVQTPPPAAVAVRPPRSGPVPRPSGIRQRSRAASSLVDDPGLDALSPDPDASVEEVLAALRERIEHLYRVLRR